jgi:hypothetical protein
MSFLEDQAISLHDWVIACHPLSPTLTASTAPSGLPLFPFFEELADDPTDD